MQRAHFQVWVGVFSCQQILIQISFVIFDIVVKTNQISFSVALVNSTDLGLCINWNVFLLLRMQKFLLVYYYSEIRATSRIWNVLPNMVFPPIRGEKMAAFRACACTLSWTLLFARPGSAPIWGGKKGEFGDWTNQLAKWMLQRFFSAIMKNRPAMRACSYSVLVRIGMWIRCCLVCTAILGKVVLTPTCSYH